MLQYIEKSEIVLLDDQDDEESKSEKDDSEQKIKPFFNTYISLGFKKNTLAKRNIFYLFDIDILPFITRDVEILPPNFI